MEDFLLRAKSMLATESQWSRVHAVLGGGEADVDSLASVLGYAYFLSQRVPSDCVCLPVLNRCRSEATVPEETLSLLQQAGVHESSLAWREDLDLLQLHESRKLSLTLLSSDVLNRGEADVLALSIVGVIVRPQQQGCGEGASSSTVTVTREILREAPELLASPLTGLLRGALLMESMKKLAKDGRLSSDCEELLGALTQDHRHSAETECQGANMDQILLKELKELSDGDIKVSISTVSVDLEHYSTYPDLVWDLKSFCDRHGYEGLVLVSSSVHEHRCHQLAVYSENKDILSQISCELEEAQNSDLEMEPMDCVLNVLQLYRLRNTSVYIEQIASLVKEFLEQRQRSFLLNSRTSSTEGVAGSAPLSQGSSGITDMYNSDLDPPSAMSVHFPDNAPPEPSEPQPALGEGGAELLSPDSGLATVRSSRSSKESSVFLSDDSPAAEMAGFLHNPALYLPSLCVSGGGHGPPELTLPASSDNFDLFGFDPLYSCNASPPTGGAEVLSGNTEERGSSSLSEFGELSLVDFYTSDEQGESEGSYQPISDSKETSRIPATPLNSLVDGSPLGQGLPRFFPEDIMGKISGTENKESVSSSEPWDDFSSDTKGSTSDDANLWSLIDVEYTAEGGTDTDLGKQIEFKDTGQRGEGHETVDLGDKDGHLNSNYTFLWNMPVIKAIHGVSDWNVDVTRPDQAETHTSQLPGALSPYGNESLEESWQSHTGLNIDTLERCKPMSLCPSADFLSRETLDSPTANVANVSHTTPRGSVHPTVRDNLLWTREESPVCEEEKGSGIHDVCLHFESLTQEDPPINGLRTEDSPASNPGEEQRSATLPSEDNEREACEALGAETLLLEPLQVYTSLTENSAEFPEDFSEDCVVQSTPTYLLQERHQSSHMWNPFVQMTQPTETYDNWNPNLRASDVWNPNMRASDVWNPNMLGNVQVTQTEEKLVQHWAVEKSAFAEKHNLLSPKEASEEDSGRDKIGSSEPDFWDYSAQKGFSEIDDFYPKSLDMWNTTICDDSQSTLTTPDVSDPSGTSDLCRGLSQGTSLESPLQAIPEGMDMWNTTVQEDTQSTITTPDTRDGAGDAGSWETPFENDTKENVAHSESRADICVENERIFNKESSKYSGTAPKEYGSPGSCSETETELSVLGSRNAADAEGSVPVEKSPEVAVSDEKSTHADDPPSHTGEHGALLTGLKKGTSDVLAWETSSAETTRGWNTDFYHSQEFVPGFGAGFKTELPQIGDFDCVRAEEDDVPAVNKQSPQPNVGTMAVSTQMVKSVSEYDNVDTSSMWDQTWSDPNDQPDLPPIIGGQPTTDGAALAQLQAVITRMDVHGREEGTDDSLGTESPVPVFHREVSFKSHTVPGVACPQTGGATPPECETNSDSNDDANLYTAVILRKETKFTSDLVLSRGNAPVSAISDEDGKWSKHSLTESERNMPEGSSVDSEYENEGESVDRTSHHSAFLLLDAGGPSEDSMFSLSQEGATSVISEGGTIHHMSSVEQLENSPSPEGMCLSAWLTAGMSPTDSCPQVEGHLEARQPSSKDTSIVLAAVSLVSLEIGSLEGAKGSPDLLQLGSREDVRSNSDGDSSGLEMDYIIVSGRGAVREDERSSREAHLGPGRITPLNPSHSSESCQVNGGVDSLYQMNTDVDRPDRTSPDMNCDHQINADLNCPCPSNMGVYSPSQTITDVNSQTIAGVNSQTIAGVNSQTITDVNSQMNNGTSSATARDSFSRFKAKEEVYVRSQISLEDSDEEDRSSPATQEWMLLDRREDPDCSPGQSSEVTHRSESDSGRSVREVGSPSACDVVGGTDSFFLHCSSPSHNCVYHKREELAHSLDLRMIQAQANQVKAIEKTMEDQVPEGWRENPAERPIGNQFLDRDGGDTAVEPIANQFLKGRTEDGAGQAMEEQFTESHQKNKAERPMEDLLLESCVGHTAGPVQDQPPQAKMECRTKQPMREKKEGILVELPPCGKPRSPLDDVAMDVPYEEGTMSPDGAENRPVPPSSLDLHGAHPPRKKLAAPPINLSLDQSEGSLLSDDALDTPDDLDINVDDLDTPDEADSLEYTGQGTELEWEETQASNQEAGNEPTEAIPEYTAEEERQDARLWRTVIIGEQEHRIDMKCIEPYQRVVSHGGYYGDLNAIIVFAACFLPDSSRDDYHYIMENLFLYVISTLELMVAEDYMIVYLNGATPRRRMPGLGWLKKCYHMIDRRLRKNLKSFIIVHPSWFIRTVLAVTRPFISSKFSSKIKYVNSLAELRELIPMEQVYIPQSIVKLDEELMEASEASTLNSFLYGPESAPDQPEADTAPCSSLS